MNVTLASCAAAVLAAVAMSGPAAARDFGPNDGDARYDTLPPVSGTIRVAPGHSRHGGHRWAHSHWLPENLAWGSRHYPRVAGYQGGIGRQIWRQTYSTAGAEAFWNRNVEFYGEGNDTLALTVTGWGTADSATTGGAYPPPSPSHRAAMPVQRTLADATWSGVERRSYGYAPTGGMAYYNSGSPGGLAYYGSSSSAGPDGTPGGLGIYSSGSYGPGPEVLHVDGRRAEGRMEGAGRGPHIIHLSRHKGYMLEDAALD